MSSIKKHKHGELSWLKTWNPSNFTTNTPISSYRVCIDSTSNKSHWKYHVSFSAVLPLKIKKNCTSQCFSKIFALTNCTSLVLLNKKNAKKRQSAWQNSPQFSYCTENKCRVYTRFPLILEMLSGAWSNGVMHIQRRGRMLIFLKILIVRLKSFIKVKMLENMPKLGWCMNLTQRRNVLCFRSSMAAILLKIQTRWIWVNHRGDRSSEQFSCSNRIKFCRQASHRPEHIRWKIVDL